MHTDIQQVLSSLIDDMVFERQLPHRNTELCEALSLAIFAMRLVRDSREREDQAMWADVAA